MMKIEKAYDIDVMVKDIVETLRDTFYHIDSGRLLTMRSYDSKANAYARIWSLPQMWQLALDINTFYVIEVLSQHFDKQSEDEKKKILIHELLHIPKTFSGALVPHGFRWGKITDKRVNKIYKEYKEIKKRGY